MYMYEPKMSKNDDSADVLLNSFVNNCFQKWLRILFWLIFPMNFQNLLRVSYMSAASCTNPDNLDWFQKYLIQSSEIGLELFSTLEFKKCSFHTIQVIRWGRVRFKPDSLFISDEAKPRIWLEPDDSWIIIGLSALWDVSWSHPMNLVCSAC